MSKRHHRLLQLFASGLFSSGIPRLPVRSGLVVELDAWAKGTRFSDAARTTLVDADSSSVGAWADRSGNGYHVSQSSSGSKPLLKTSVKNGRDALLFDGTDDFLRNTAFPDFGDTYTIFAVIAQDSTGDNSQGVHEVSNGTSDTGFRMYDTANLVSSMRGTAGTNVGTVNYKDNNWYIHNQINTGTENRFYTNAGAPQTGAYTAPNPNTLNQLDIGRLVVSFYLKGYFGHLSIFSGALSDENRLHTALLRLPRGLYSAITQQRRHRTWERLIHFARQ